MPFYLFYGCSMPDASDSNALIDPYEIEEDKWIDDVSIRPPVDFENIYTYLVDTQREFT